jgi:mono/diheme cytochrome c family protein
MILHKSFLLFPFLALAYLMAGDKVNIKKTPATYTFAGSGQEMYMSYCAACHGRDAKGNGPAAPALKTAPTDLTTLTLRNDNKFPGMRVSGILRGNVELVSHGSVDMPIWGPILKTVSAGNPQGAELRITNLTDYIKSIQASPGL